MRVAGVLVNTKVAIAIGLILLIQYELWTFHLFSEDEFSEFKLPGISEMSDVADARKKDKLSVLILSLGRSGSTYLQEMLTLSPTSLAVSEPLSLYRGGDSAIYYSSEEDNANIRRIIEGVFTCEKRVYQSALNMSMDPICADANPLVVKTIRLRRNHIWKWLKWNNIKVIHLVRDPRGRFNSIRNVNRVFVRRKWKKVKVGFENSETNFIETCQKWMRQDLLLAQDLPKERYTMVKYEELVDNPNKLIKELYDFMGVPISSAVWTAIEAHRSDNMSSPLENPFSTKRNRTFRHDHWKEDLEPTIISKLESECALKELGYEEIS